MSDREQLDQLDRPERHTIDAEDVESWPEDFMYGDEADAYIDMLLASNKRKDEQIRKARELLQRLTLDPMFEPLSEGMSEEQQLRAEGDIIAERIHNEALAWLAANAPEETHHG